MPSQLKKPIVSSSSGSTTVFDYNNDYSDWYKAGEGYEFAYWSIIGDSGNEYKLYGSKTLGRTINVPWWDFLDSSKYNADAKIKIKEFAFFFTQENLGYGDLATSNSGDNITQDDSTNITYNVRYNNKANISVTANPVDAMQLKEWKIYQNYALSKQQDPPAPTETIVVGGNATLNGISFASSGNTITVTSTDNIVTDNSYRIVACYERKLDENGEWNYIEIEYKVEDIANNVNFPLILTVGKKSVSNLTEYGKNGNVSAAPTNYYPSISEIVPAVSAPDPSRGNNAIWYVADNAIIQGCTASVNGKYSDYLSDGLEYYFVGWKDQKKYMFLQTEQYYQPVGLRAKDRLYSGNLMKDEFNLNDDITDHKIIFWAEGRQTKNYYIVGYVSPYTENNGVITSIQLRYNRTYNAETGEYSNSVTTNDISKVFYLGAKSGQTDSNVSNDDELLHWDVELIGINIRNKPANCQVEYWSFNGDIIYKEDGVTYETDTAKILEYINKKIIDEFSTTFTDGNHIATIICKLTNDDADLKINYVSEYKGRVSNNSDTATYSNLHDGIYDEVTGSIAYPAGNFEFLGWYDGPDEDAQLITMNRELHYDIIKLRLNQDDIPTMTEAEFQTKYPDVVSGTNVRKEYTFYARFTDMEKNGKVTYNINLKDSNGHVAEADVATLGDSKSYLAYLTEIYPANGVRNAETALDGTSRADTITVAPYVSGDIPVVYTTNEVIGYAQSFKLPEKDPTISADDYKDLVFVAWYDPEKTDANQAENGVNATKRPAQFLERGAETEFKYVYSSNVENYDDNDENIYDLYAVWATVEIPNVVVRYDNTGHTIEKVITTLAEPAEKKNEIKSAVGNGISAQIVGYSTADVQPAVDGVWTSEYSETEPGNYTPWVKIQLTVGDCVTYTVAQADLTIVPGEVKLTKYSSDKDKTGNRITLSNAVFKLYAVDDNNANAQEIALGANNKTLANGTLTVNGLAEGKYYFEEATAPAGYEKSDRKIYFRITDDNIVIDEDGTITIVDELVECYNDPTTYQLTINKTIDARVDAFGNPTFIFKVTGPLDDPVRKSAEQIKILEIETGTSGQIEFDLVPGKYEVTELDSARYTVDGNADRSVTVTNSDLTENYTNTLTNYAKFSSNDNAVNSFSAETSDKINSVSADYTGDAINISDFAAAEYKLTEEQKSKLTFTITRESGSTEPVAFEDLDSRVIVQNGIYKGIEFSYQYKDSAGKYAYVSKILPINMWEVKYNANSGTTPATTGSLAENGKGTNILTTYYDGNGLYDGTISAPTSANTGMYVFESWSGSDTISENAERKANYRSDVPYIIYLPGTAEGDQIKDEWSKNYRIRNGSTFEAPTGKDFSYWIGSDGHNYTPDQIIVSKPDSNLTLTAVWVCKISSFRDGMTWESFADTPGKKLLLMTGVPDHLGCDQHDNFDCSRHDLQCHYDNVERDIRLHFVCTECDLVGGFKHLEQHQRTYFGCAECNSRSSEQYLERYQWIYFLCAEFHFLCYLLDLE